jgi:thiamine-phosphate pyrophosphorylase
VLQVAAMISPAAFGPTPFVYPVIDTDVCVARGFDPMALAAACLAGGARIVQLRCKRDSSAAFLALADRLVQIAREWSATVIINDRPDIARLSGAAGVHVGQEDLLVADVHRVAGADAIVGLSTHNTTQVDAALTGPATYIAVGPIFGTTTKDTGYDARGLELVRYAAGRGKPVVAIGGITLERAARVVDAGATGIAVISDLLTGGDAEWQTRRFISAIAAPIGDRFVDPRDKS